MKLNENRILESINVMKLLRGQTSHFSKLKNKLQERWINFLKYLEMVKHHQLTVSLQLDWILQVSRNPI